MASLALQPVQQPPQTPVFRSRVDLARLDVTVIDNKTGKPLNGLREADFTISENGVTQKISTFAREIITADSPSRMAPDKPGPDLRLWQPLRPRAECTSVTRDAEGSTQA